MANLNKRMFAGSGNSIQKLPNPRLDMLPTALTGPVNSCFFFVVFFFLLMPHVQGKQLGSCWDGQLS